MINTRSWPARSFAAVLVATASLHVGAALAQGKTAALDPCRLLTDAEVRKVFADAKPARLDRSREKLGVYTCVWDHPGGRFFAQQHTGELEPFTVEGRGLIDGFIDPVKPGAEKAVRFENVKGVGDRAMVVIEKRDPARGILNDIAQLVTQRGSQQVILFSSQLPQRDRAAAMKALEELGRAAAQRL